MNQKNEKPRRVIEVPAMDYQPTLAEQRDTFCIDATPEDLARRMLEPVEVREISAKEWRRRRREDRRSAQRRG